MTAREPFARQVALLVRLLPSIYRYKEVFALKGGTAINLFHRNLPRLSVDIDLTYLPVKDRNASLAEIDETLSAIMDDAKSLRGVTARRIAGGGGGATRILADDGKAMIKVETSPVTRGIVGNTQTLPACDLVMDEFGFAEAEVVSFEDLYGGKIHAALDRQHPRDLFDIAQLYENEGLTDELLRTFMVYLASSSRPVHELLDPNGINIEQAFKNEFVGMTQEPVDLADLIAARQMLIEDIQGRLHGPVAEFLRSLQAGDPDFDVLGYPEAAKLPAIRWKLQNLRRLIDTDPNKHVDQTEQLHRLLS
ncbi:nucleotidyl transferase AbiEii/AbiGii toxin family protein [Nitratireductor sp. XY-223]|uniref:nucleotidyl transferase AbiEii/AbiGii toxin family protein n=1 Tax=Nitratireductor sp. XY-223 TaxID=2561926 RepID=UPI0010A9EB48|nr:nucleotidyl transferase AbiEii/AbiGii toxin family protein [Nitratireductor sp. XY-223]